MNILYLSTHLNIGGISSYVFTLAKGLKKRGHCVYIASSAGELLPKFINEGINYIPIPIKTKSEANFLKISLSLFRLLKQIKKKNIDIIHANTRVTQVLSYFLQRYSGRPYISTCHGFFKKRFFRKIFPCWGEKIIAISEPVKSHLIKDLGVSEDRVRVVHSGIDVEKFKTQNSKRKTYLRKKIGLSEGPVSGIIARLSEEKGHTYLIEAMKDVLQKFPSAQLVIAGEGRTRKNLVNLTRSLGIARNVFFIPNIFDTKEVLFALDIFVLPSLKEGLGLSLMEAMACGLGVIGSDVGGIKTLIQHNYNGLLVKPADAKGLSVAILELVEDDKKRQYLGNNARNFITQNFSQEKMVSETEGVYLECLKEKD